MQYIKDTNQKTIRVFIDGVINEINIKDLKNYNVLISRSNGFSNDYLVSEQFDKKKHFIKQIYKNERIIHAPLHLTKKKEIGFIQGSSVVSFS